MKRLLRSVIAFDDKLAPEALASNYQKLLRSGIEWTRGDDGKIFKFVQDYFRQHLDTPSAQTITDFFTADLEIVERVKDIAVVTAYSHSNFTHLLTGLLEDQNRVKALTTLKEAQEIISRGLEIDGTKLKGTRDGLLYVAQKASELIIPDTNARTRGNIRDDAQAVWTEYEIAELDKSKAWGKFTGINNIDVACHGIKKGELWVHAAFAGELKCLSGDVTVFDHNTQRRRRLKEMFDCGSLPLVTALENEGASTKLVLAQASHLVQNGEREVFDLTLTSGRTIGATANHKFFTPNGWKQLSELEIGDFVATPKQLPTVGVDPGDIYWDTVKSKVFRGIEMTYDLSIPKHHTFVANDIITHNTTLATNWCYNLITYYRANIFYASLEMKYEHIRRLMYARHSANPLFMLQGYTSLDYRKIRDGELTPEEKAYFALVCKDFSENEKYCDFDTWSPDRDLTVDDIKVEAEILHRQKELGMIVIDHGGLAEARKGKKNKDYTVELNSVIRDAKKLALQFNHGEGIPVLLLFQINRDGKDYADKNNGEYKMRALSYSNECLAEGTLVRTTSGLVPIQDVQPGVHQVWSSTGWKDVSAHFDQGSRSTVNVQTKRGPTVTCTPEHLFRVVTATGLQWVPAKDLQGQCVLADMGDQSGHCAQDFLEFWKQMYRRQSWPIGDLYTRVYNRYVSNKKHFKGKIPHFQVLFLAFLTRGVSNDSDVTELRQLCMCRPYWVQQVVPGKCVPVFDLEVSGDHEYSTGGLLTHNCERSADVVTTTYLNKDLRDRGLSHICNLKNRDNPLFEPFDVAVEWRTRRLFNVDAYASADGQGVSVDDTRAIMDLARL